MNLGTCNSRLPTCGRDGRPVRSLSVACRSTEGVGPFCVLFVNVFLSTFKNKVVRRLPTRFDKVGFASKRINALFSLIVANVVVTGVSIKTVGSGVSSAVALALVIIYVLVTLFFLTAAQSFLTLSVIVFVLTFKVNKPTILAPLIIDRVFNVTSCPHV